MPERPGTSPGTDFAAQARMLLRLAGMAALVTACVHDGSDSPWFDDPLDPLVVRVTCEDQKSVLGWIRNNLDPASPGTACAESRAVATGGP